MIQAGAEHALKLNPGAKAEQIAGSEIAGITRDRKDTQLPIGYPVRVKSEN